MRSLTRQQRPGTTNSSAVERRAVFVLSISIAVVAVPVWAGRQFDAQHRIDHLDGVEYSWVVGPTQAEAHQRQRIGTDNLNRRRIRASGHTVLRSEERRVGKECR